MRYLLFWLFFCPVLFAHETSAVQLEGTLYSELEKTRGHSLQTATQYSDITLADESEKLTTFYTIVNYTLSGSDDQWILNLEGRAALQLSSDPYTSPVYRSLYGDEEINKAVVSQASVDYYGDDFAWSVGRNQLDLDWLSGSFDSLLFYSMKPWIETRLFWFIDYYDFQYNYYTKYTGINDDKGIAGIYLQSGEALENWEWACFYYHVFDQAYLSGLKLSKPLEFMNIQAEYSYLNAISEGKLPEESFLRIQSEVDISDAQSITVGFSRTGSHGLTAMLRFGAHTFSQFYLTGAVDRPDAKNLYLQYRYENNRFSFETVGGITSYHDKSLEGSRLVDRQMQAYELDLNLEYALSDHASLALGYMLLDLDEKDNLAFDQDLLTLSMSVEWS